MCVCVCVCVCVLCVSVCVCCHGSIFVAMRNWLRDTGVCTRTRGSGGIASGCTGHRSEILIQPGDRCHIPMFGRPFCHLPLITCLDKKWVPKHEDCLWNIAELALDCVSSALCDLPLAISVHSGTLNLTHVLADVDSVASWVARCGLRVLDASDDAPRWDDVQCAQLRFSCPAQVRTQARSGARGRPP